MCYTGFMSWQSGPSWRSAMGPRMPTNHQGFRTFFGREFLQKNPLFCHGKPRWRGRSKICGFTSFFPVCCFTCGCACFFGVEFYVFACGLMLLSIWISSILRISHHYPGFHKKHMLRTCVCLNSYVDWKWLKLVTSTFDVSYFWGCRDCQVGIISPFAGCFQNLWPLNEQRIDVNQQFLDEIQTCSHGNCTSRSVFHVYLLLRCGYCRSTCKGTAIHLVTTSESNVTSQWRFENFGDSEAQQESG